MQCNISANRSRFQRVLRGIPEAIVKCARKSAARQELVMETVGLVIFTVVGMALIAGLSVVLHAALPESALDSASRHGRYAAS
jgi:hypothetical protein